MRLLLGDDHELVRETIAAFLTREGDIDVRTASDLGSAVESIRADPALDLVLLDFSMPGMRGLAGLAEVRALVPGCPVALLSGTAVRQVAEEALAMGAAGFLPKTMTTRALVNAVRFMAAGEIYAPVEIMTDRKPAEGEGLAGRLTLRETEVLRRLCLGLSNKEIARELDLQEVTVKLHVKTLCRKIEARNRTQAAMIAKEASLC